MSDVVVILEKLKEEGFSLWLDGEKLRYKAPKESITKANLLTLKRNKEEIIQVLQNYSKRIVVEVDSDNRYEPFPLTDVQTAYLMGRNNLFDYGGVACHVYLELKYKNLDVSRVRLVWNKLIQTHDMLRTVVFEEGYQQVLKEVPELEIPYWDVSKGENICEYNDFRQQMGNHVYDTGKWPMFGIAIAKKAEESILHFSMDFLIADWTSIWMLLSEFEALYYLKKDSINVPQITFRDYLSAERKLKESERYVNDKRYWEKRIAYLPDAPELPTLSAEDVKKNFTRKLLCLDSERWNSFKDAAKKLGITPSTAILTAYSDVIAKWSCNKSFCINLTVLNRFPLHDDVTDIVGDFTTLNLLEINANDGNNFAERARKINERLFIDLDHRLFGGVEVIRELSKQRNKRVFMPIVYTSAIGLADQNRQITGKFDGGITQTPQVFIDCQAMDGDFGLQINWDVREGVFPDGMIDDMFDLFQQRIEELAKDETDWNKINGLFLPQWQADERNVANHTETDLPIHLLQSGFMEWAQKAPDRVAVTDGEKKLTYGELHQYALKIRQKIVNVGAKHQDCIAIAMNKNSTNDFVTKVWGNILTKEIITKSVVPDLLKNIDLKQIKILDYAQELCPPDVKGQVYVSESEIMNDRNKTYYKILEHPLYGRMADTGIIGVLTHDGYMEFVVPNCETSVETPDKKEDTHEEEIEKPIVKEIMKIWKEVFEIEDISIQDDFYTLGGDSIILMRLVDEMCKTLGCDVTVDDILQSENISDLANRV